MNTLKKNTKKIENSKETIFSTSELEELLGNRMVISQLCKEGILRKVSRGYYVKPSISELEYGYAIVSKFYNSGIIVGESALWENGIGQFMPEITEVCDPSGKNSHITEVIKFVPISKNKLIGIEERTIRGFKVKIFSKERALIESFKLYGHSEMFYRCLIDYYNSGVNISKLDNLKKYFKSQVSTIKTGLFSIQQKDDLY